MRKCGRLGVLKLGRREAAVAEEEAEEDQAKRDRGRR
jgi:hypothetical protein